MQTHDQSQDPKRSPNPTVLSHHARVRQVGRYVFPVILMVVGAGFGSGAIYYRIQEAALQKSYVEAQRRSQEIRERLDHEAKLRQAEPGLAITSALVASGNSVEEKRLSQEQIDCGQKQSQALGIALATGGVGVICLMLISIFDRGTRRAAPAPLALAVLSFVVTSAAYALILRHRAANLVLFPSCFPILVGGLLPLFLLRPLTIWGGGIKPTKALLLFLIPAAADLIGIALLYYQAEEPMGVLFGQTFAYTDLSDNWYIGVALVQWSASLVAFYLAFLFRTRLAESLGSAANGHSA